MNKFVTSALVVIAVIGGIAYSVWRPQPQSPQLPTATEKSLSECVGAAENAVAGIVPVIEFQKLELEGRKASVIRRCMADQGYRENLLWLAYAKPIAERNAKAQGISSDEALETVKRSSMVAFKPEHNEPVFWIANKALPRNTK